MINDIFININESTLDMEIRYQNIRNTHTYEMRPFFSFHTTSFDTLRSYLAVSYKSIRTETRITREVIRPYETRNFSLLNVVLSWSIDITLFSLSPAKYSLVWLWLIRVVFDR